MPDPHERDSFRQELIESGFFDTAWYLWRNDDVAAAGQDPLDHFLDFGHAEGRWPNRYFDPAWYRLEYPDVAAAGVDPLRHYLTYGEKEGRRPHPLFDPVWYRAAYGIEAGQLALGHFVANRMSGRFVPSAGLYAVPLIQPYRDDPAAGADPIAHYIDDILASGADPFPDLAVVCESRLIDENYYLINAADVQEANADPACHYCSYGWRERRKPNIYFDPAWYEQTNPVIAQMQINPLVHYILAGEQEDRRPVPFFDPGWYRAEYRLPADKLALAHYLANRRKQIYSPTPLFDVRWYVARFGEDLGPNRDPFAHYLQAGMTQDIDPSRWFNAARYRQTHLGRPSRGFSRTLRPEQHNPLVHYLRSEYERHNQNREPPQEAGYHRGERR
jgi:hypothetical protein